MIDFSTFKTLQIGNQSVVKLQIDGVTVFAIDSGGGDVKPCFAVVDDITTYTATTYTDVYDNATSKWYKLNNLKQYEEYGIYEEVDTLEVASVKLPEDYTEVEYIENTSTAYIDTGVNGGSKMAYEIAYMLSSDSQSSQWPQLFAGDASNNSKIWHFRTSTSGVYTLNVNDYTVNQNVNTKYTIKYDTDGNTYIDNTLVTTKTNTDWGSLTYWLFCSHGETTLYSKAKVYSLKMWDGDTLLREYIPCKNSSGVYGFYEVVNGEFKPSATSTAFGGGDEVKEGITVYTNKLVNYPIPSSRLPEGYTEVEYIGNNNYVVNTSSSAQYIDTNYNPTANTDIEIKFRINTSHFWRRIFGCYDSDNNFYSLAWTGNDNASSGSLAYQRPTESGYNSLSTISTGSIYTVKTNGLTCTIYDADNNIVSTCSNSGTLTDVDMPIYLFTLGGVSIECNLQDIYYCNILEDGDVVRQFIPAKNSSGIYGMYEVKEGKWYASPSGVSFGRHGNAVEGDTVNMEYKWDGSQWVNQGEIIDEEEYFITNSSTSAQYVFGHYWGNGYKVVIDMEIDASYSSNDNHVIEPSNATSPLEIMLYHDGFFYDFHAPQSSTDNSCDSGDNTYRLMQTSVSALPKDGTRIKFEVTDIAVKIYKYSDNTLLYSSTYSSPTYDWYDGLYYAIADSNSTSKPTVKVHSYTVYNADGDIVNNLVYKYQGGDTNQLYLYDTVLGESYQNVNNASVSYVCNITTTYPTEYDTKVAPANNVQYSSLELLKAMECPWIGMIGYVVTSRLPEGYTEVEYVTNENGGGYIDLGYVANSNSKYQIKMLVISSNGGEIFGDDWSNDSNDYRVFLTNNKNIFFDCGSKRIYDANGYSAFSDVIELEVGNYYVKDISTNNNIITGSTQTVSRSANLKIFGNSSDTERIYYFKIYEGDTLIMDLVPCKNSSNTYGFYDLVGGQFLSSSSSALSGGGMAGDSTKYQYTESGWEIYVAPESRLPDGYTEVEYVDCTGSGYFDTGVNGGTAMAFELIYSIDSNCQTNYPQLFAGDKSSVAKKVLLSELKKSAGTYQVTVQNSSGGKAANQTFGTKYTLNVNTDGSVYMDGSSLGTMNTGGWGTLTYWLWCSHGETSLYCQAKVYSLKMWDGDTLLREYVPCKNSSGTYGLYDLVNSTFGTATATLSGGDEV